MHGSAAADADNALGTGGKPPLCSRSIGDSCAKRTSLEAAALLLTERLVEGARVQGRAALLSQLSEPIQSANVPAQPKN